MRLNQAAFNGLLANIGQRFMWSRAYVCPNINPNSGASLAGCPICGGRGRFWPQSVAAIAGVASQKVQQQWAQFGLYQSGDTVLSVPENSAIYDAGQFDRLLALNTAEQFSVNLTAGANDRLLVPVQSIGRVFWMTADLTAVVDGSIPAFDADGNLTWPLGGGPPAGQTYSVSGVQLQEFFVFMDYPANRFEHQGARLPKRIVARRFDLFGR